MKRGPKNGNTIKTICQDMTDRKPGLSRLLRHLARKLSGSILTTLEPARVCIYDEWRAVDSVVKVMDLHPANLGSTPASAYMSYWCQQKGVWPKLVSCANRSPTYISRHIKPLNKAVNDVKFWHYLHQPTTGQIRVAIIMPRPWIGGGIKRCFCLTSVCRVHRA